MRNDVGHLERAQADGNGEFSGMVAKHYPSRIWYAACDVSFDSCQLGGELAPAFRFQVT
jgi:hypothetical protein